MLLWVYDLNILLLIYLSISFSIIGNLSNELILFISSLSYWLSYNTPTLIENLKVVPYPKVDSIFIFPYIFSTISLLIINPSPIPFLFSPSLFSIFPKALKSNLNFSDYIPGPVSSISKFKSQRNGYSLLAFYSWIWLSLSNFLFGDE